MAYFYAHSRSSHSFIHAGPIISPSDGSSLGHKLYSYAAELHKQFEPRFRLLSSDEFHTLFEIVMTLENAKLCLEELSEADRETKRKRLGTLNKIYSSLLDINIDMSQRGYDIPYNNSSLSRFSQKYEKRLSEIKAELGRM